MKILIIFVARIKGGNFLQSRIWYSNNKLRTVSLSLIIIFPWIKIKPLTWKKSMALNSKTQQCLLFLLLHSHIAVKSSSPILSADPPTPEPTVYEILPKFGLPSGLLPDSVTSYTLSKNGEFELNLKKPCYIKFDYLVYYKKKITGKLKMGSITNLKGIQVKRFLFWFNVDEISVDLPRTDSIYFSVGIINKKLNVDQFRTVRSCKADALMRQVISILLVLIVIWIF